MSYGAITKNITKQAGEGELQGELKRSWNFQDDQEKIVWNFQGSWFPTLKFPRDLTSTILSKFQGFVCFFWNFQG